MTLTNFEKQPIWQSVDSTSLFPIDERTRDIAVGLFELVQDLPIISPHGHVDPNLLLENKPFESAADLFIYFNHYITRLMHADGVSLSELLRPKGLEGAALEAHGRKAWQHFADRWHHYAGTASGYWFVREMGSVFGIDREISSENAQEFYDLIQAELATERMLPRNLFREFNINLLATTDSPTDDLAAHQKLAQLDLGGRVAPTFRPDAFINPLAPGWVERVREVVAMTAEQLTQAGFVASLAKRREFFKANGGFSVDIGAETAYTTILDDQTAQRLFELGLKGELTADQALEYRGHMISEMIRQSCEDGLVITLHVGVHRLHSTATFEQYGPDTGHDIPIRAEFVKNLHPVLERYGLNKNLHLVLFALDETTWSREIAPLAGFYPSVFVGAPWWFYDAPDATRRFRQSVTDTVGFYRGSGFIDDTRAFLSIPTRHEMARRIDSTYLAELVSQQRISLSTAEKIAVDLVTEVPKRAFKL